MLNLLNFAVHCQADVISWQDFSEKSSHIVSKNVIIRLSEDLLNVYNNASIALKSASFLTVIRVIFGSIFS